MGLDPRYCVVTSGRLHALSSTTLSLLPSYRCFLVTYPYRSYRSVCPGMLLTFTMVNIRGQVLPVAFKEELGQSSSKGSFTGRS